ncbi:NGG1p interacting factor NIF3 [Desulforudis sp. 1088]|uniref:NGG1p interacting factor NIF3 n=1 Tax=unclassified Candidatus Desulforudis TaxID=2635950 RepID=UPI00346DF7E4
MKLGELYRLAVEKGIAHDPRGKAEVQAYLAREKDKFNDMKADEKDFYDEERLHNPYSDTRILYGDPEREVGVALVGIDMEVGEVLLADRLREKGQTVDLIVAHHPEGKAMAALYDVMHLQEDILAELGVPINVAEGLMAARISEVKRALLPLNHNRAVDAARLLDIPFMCVHTAADNLVTDYLQKLIEEKKPRTLKDVIKCLKEIPEFAEAAKQNAGPTIVVGAPERRAGKIVVDMTGGTSGSEDAYSKLVDAGVGTLVVMHMTEKHRKEAEKNNVNVIIAGHMASDSLGLNLFLDEVAKCGVKIIPTSGLIRVDRRDA